MKYDKLNRPLKDRVAFYKKRHDPQSCIGDWREMRKVIGGYLNPVSNRSSDGRFWLEAGHGFRVSKAGEHVRLRHTGWFVDSFQSDTTHGIVVNLSHGRWLAGYSDPWNDDCYCVELYVYGDAQDAAFAAESMAERFAEDCREADEKFQAEQDIEDARERIGSLREQVVALVQSIRKSTLDSVVCERLRADVRGMLAEKTRLYERIEELEGQL
jgi:hypothetical protein